LLFDYSFVLFGGLSVVQWAAWLTGTITFCGSSDLKFCPV